MSDAANLSPRRILHLRTVVGRGGGPEKTLLNSHRFLRSDYDLCLAYFYPKGDERFDLPARAEAVGARLVAIPECGPCDPRAFRKLAGLIRRYRPNILHAHDYKTNVLSVVFGKAFGIPAVTTLHGYVSLSPRLKAYYRIDRWALRRMRKVVAVSSELIEVARRAKVPPARIALIENGIDLEQFCPDLARHDAKARLGVDPRTFVLGAVGRLSSEKGFDLLIRAVARQRQNGWRGLLLIAGEGPERQRLEALIEQLKCDDVVRLAGYRPDVAELLQACDAFILSSRQEAFPNVVLEAMALKIPIIATRVGGITDILEDGKSGLLVASEDELGIAKAIQRLVDDPALGPRLATAARQVCEERYCFRRRMQKEQAIYDEILAAPALAT